MTDCFMCAIVAEATTVEWYDEVLFESDHTIVVPALGAIVPGHVLVVPQVHARSVQLLDSIRRADFTAALTAVIGRLEELFGAVTVFEHGAATAGSGPRSACSEHAHIQLLPERSRASADLANARQYRTLAHFYDSEPPFDPYLMIKDPESDPRVAPDVGVSQYFRRVILAELGEPDTWDYWAFPRYDNVRATIAAFGDR